MAEVTRFSSSTQMPQVSFSTIACTVPRIFNFDENSLLPVRATYGLRLCRFSDYTQTHWVIFLSCYQVQHTCVFSVFLCMQRLLINKMVCVIATINIHFGNFLPPPQVYRSKPLIPLTSLWTYKYPCSDLAGVGWGCFFLYPSNGGRPLVHVLLSLSITVSASCPLFFSPLPLSCLTWLLITDTHTQILSSHDTHRLSDGIRHKQTDQHTDSTDRVCFTLFQLLPSPSRPDF